MQKLLITFGTRPLAIRLSKLVQNKYKVLLSTSEEVPSVLKEKYLTIPIGTNPTFSHEVLKLALDNNVQFILPLGAAEIQAIGESVQLFEEYGIRVICPSKNELLGLDVLFDPTKDLPLSVVLDRVDLISDQPVACAVNGLGIVSDSGDDFVLAVLK
ncbi:hypothetical protein FAZ15_08305 [Sphingobacterium olei]|uniref:Carbamoyl phosphate synthase large subunit n=1 Tax=Sphingobacterium olei TaxID=2571155 RepID=A0A4U0PEP2_9SPHI|nr:hypothetical protein [Sphingobacterium olei]TJZ61194.1 hypothetical protein FAZ15_08305 [Sphingobacterium olei]